MKVNIETFLVFPGILITIGVFLLILSIIIVIIAYKSVAKEEKNDFLNEVRPLDVNTPINEEMSDANLGETKIFDFGNNQIPKSNINSPEDELDKMPKAVKPQIESFEKPTLDESIEEKSTNNINLFENEFNNPYEMPKSMTPRTNKIEKNSLEEEEKIEIL